MINANDFFEISFKKDYNSVPYKLIKITDNFYKINFR